MQSNWRLGGGKGPESQCNQTDRSRGMAMHTATYARAMPFARELDLDFPALTISRLDVLIRLGRVLELALGVVPHQLAFLVDRRRAEHQPLGVLRRDGEVRAGRRAALAGADPVAGVRRVIAAGARAGRPLQVRLGELVLRPASAWKQADSFAPAAGAPVAPPAGRDGGITATAAPRTPTAAP